MVRTAGLVPKWGTHPLHDKGEGGGEVQVVQEGWAGVDVLGPQVQWPVQTHVYRWAQAVNHLAQTEPNWAWLHMGLETAFQSEASLKALTRAMKKLDSARNALFGAFMVSSSLHAASPGIRQEAKRFNTSICFFSIHPRKARFAACFKAAWESAHSPSKSPTQGSGL